jgi:inorganic pyrophosphatase
MPEESLHCLIEIPKGSRNKYVYDEALGGIKLERFLFSSVVYPTDYGFVPETRSESGERLDAMVAVSEPTFPGCVIAVRTVGVLRTEDDTGQDDKLLCVPCDDPNWDHLQDLGDVPERMRVEIERFVAIYKEPEGRETTIRGWEDAAVAQGLLREARDRFSAAE